MYLIQFLLDLIFPKFCFGCDKEGTWFCKTCFKKIKKLDNQCCPICRSINNGQVCNECNNKTKLSGLTVSTSYEDKLIKKLIKNYKYNNIIELYLPISNLILNQIPINIIKQKYVIVPVPLHKKRYLERGYNQSSLIAKYIAKKLNMHYIEKSLIRVKNTQPQAKLVKKQRQSNLKSAFNVTNKFDFYGKNVIIIDDVATTLTTMNCCAKQLKKAGANKIWGVVIARGNYKL